MNVMLKPWALPIGSLRCYSGHVQGPRTPVTQPRSLAPHPSPHTGMIQNLPPKTISEDALWQESPALGPVLFSLLPATPPAHWQWPVLQVSTRSSPGPCQLGRQTAFRPRVAGRLFQEALLTAPGNEPSPSRCNGRPGV